jgi:hypothetical protein
VHTNPITNASRKAPSVLLAPILANPPLKPGVKRNFLIVKSVEISQDGPTVKNKQNFPRKNDRKAENGDILTPDGSIINVFRAPEDNEVCLQRESDNPSGLQGLPYVFRDFDAKQIIIRHGFSEELVSLPMVLEYYPTVLKRPSKKLLERWKKEFDARPDWKKRSSFEDRLQELFPEMRLGKSSQ